MVRVNPRTGSEKRAGPKGQAETANATWVCVSERAVSKVLRLLSATGKERGCPGADPAG